MNVTSRAKQIKIYTEKNLRIFINEKGWKVFITSTIITLIICMVTSSDMFADYIATRNGAFAIVCACIWIGIFNSIQSICKERDIIKREHRSGLHISSYILSHMIYEMILCAIESVIVTILISLANMSNLPSEGVMTNTFFELLITIFLIIYSSDVLGIMVSCIVKTPDTAMTVMPFILILQLVMSGMIFELEGFTKTISLLTIAKWGLNAICITSNVNAMDGFDPRVIADYEYSVAHISQMWLLLIAFIIAYGAISIICLEFIDRDKR